MYSRPMADQFYYHNIPAVRFPYVECDIEQLRRLSGNAQDILSILEYTKRSVIAIGQFQARVDQNRVVRCTKNSVMTTAAARYGLVDPALDLRSVPINVFVDLVVFLPLIDIRTLANNADALRKVTQLFSSRALNPRWGTYHTYLTECNAIWAKRFFSGKCTSSCRSRISLVTCMSTRCPRFFAGFRRNG